MNSDQNSRGFMDIAKKAAKHSNCRRKRVGAILVRGDKVLVRTANGTPDGMMSCDDGGCPRCLSEVPRGDQYEECVCLHAEQSVIAQAARAGVPTSGAILYCTVRPCLTCMKISLEAGINRIVYDEDIQFTPEVEEASRHFSQMTELDVLKI